jgi:hypothetical protein
VRSCSESIQAAQLRASVAINHELVLLYWQIGREILEGQEKKSWGPSGNRFEDGSLPPKFAGK